jgi:hypothetical protein
MMAHIPDLNPIEQIWTELKAELKQLVNWRNPSSVSDLRAVTDDEWMELTKELCLKYVSTMPEVLLHKKSQRRCMIVA